MDHTERNHLIITFQLTYHQKHSANTGLLKVKTDLNNAMDNQEVTCLVLSDLSVAFDMVGRSQDTSWQAGAKFWIKGTTLSWMKSYVSNSTPCLIISDTNTDGAKSPSVPLSFGVLEGSVLGSILFTLYMALLGQLCREHNIIYHMYANDTQLYLSFKPGPPGTIRMQLDCIA